MDFLPESEIINLKYQLAQQIKANVNRAASSKSSNIPFLESFIDTLIDEIANLKIEISKLSLSLSDLQNSNLSESLLSSDGYSESSRESQNLTNENNVTHNFPLHLEPQYLQNIANFYYPEGDKNNNYIWMGPENKTSIVLPLNVTFPIKLTFKDVRFITSNAKESLEIYINGERLELGIFKQNEGYTITAIWLPINNSNQCQIDIYVEQSIYVREIYPDTSDTRKLTMALREIEIHNSSLEYVNT